MSGPYVTLPVRAGATLMASVSHLSLTGVKRRGGAGGRREGEVGQSLGEQACGGGAAAARLCVNRLID